MKHKLKISFLIIVLTYSFIATGQIFSKEGYIITLKNDTVYGLISERGIIGNTKVCRFNENKGSKTIDYYPTDIKSFRFSNGDYYQSITVTHKGKPKKAFVEVLLDGEVKLYRYWKERDKKYYIEKENGDAVGLINELITIKDTSKTSYDASNRYAFEIETYKDTLASVFNNCMAIQASIDELEYETKPLMNITKDYINCICNRNDCISFEKNFDLVKPSFGVFAGAQLSKVSILSSDIQSNLSTSYPLGLFFNIPIPQLTYRLSLQFELLYNRKIYDQGFVNIPAIYSDINISSSLVGLPILLKYKLPLNKLTPSVGVGKEFAYVFNSKANMVPVELVENSGDFDNEFATREKGFFVHNMQKEGWFLDLGLEYKVNHKLAVYTNIRAQTCLNLIIEEENYNNSMFSVAEKKNYLNNPHSNIYRTNSATLFFGIKF